MKFKTIAIGTGVLVAAAALTFAGLMAVTGGAQSMARTVSADRDLPRLEGDGVWLHGEVHGPKSAPLVIVLHGGPGGDYRSLLALADLSDTHRVLFFDQRGAGLSQRVSPDQLTVDHYLADIDTLADSHAGGEPVILIGHSWGSMLAVAYMGRRPDRVAKSVLIEPGFLDPAGYADWDARRQHIARAPSVLREGLLAGFRARNVADVDDHAQRDFIVGSVVHAFADHKDNPYHCPDTPYGAVSWRFGALASDTFWADPAPMFDAMARGLSTQTPILFLAGGCNDWTGEGLQTDHAKAFENATLVTIEGAGHDVVWDQGDAALSALRRFLD